MPGVTFFKPAGVPLKLLQETHLSVEEAEALRLKDLEGMEQEPAAVRMNISRPTFQRILASARRKVADAILNGKAIRIAGGDFVMDVPPCCCRRLGHDYARRAGTGMADAAPPGTPPAPAGSVITNQNQFDID
jgi:predicted DNA-binding protein (UPF0251 family)